MIYDFILKFEMPNKLFNVQGPSYENELFQESTLFPETKKLQTTPCNSKSDGLTEKLNVFVK